MKTDGGTLIVFEGPDGVGKTTLARLLYAQLQQQNRRHVHLLAYPGNDEGTLGEAVYRLHHGPLRMAPAAKQALHLAAHLDVIEMRILPALYAGDVVIMDRYWWSLAVYGAATNAPHAVMEEMVNTELAAWHGRQPDMLFLLERTGCDLQLQHFYQDIFNVTWETLAGTPAFFPVTRLMNNWKIEDVLRTAVAVLKESRVIDA